LGSHRRRLLIVLLAASTASFERVPAYAAPLPAPPAPAADAGELAAADAAVRAKDWASALLHFQAALAAVPSPRAALGAADALYRLGRLGDAYEAYGEAQRTYGPKFSFADKSAVTSRLAELGPKTGWLSIRVGEPGADVTIDGKPFGTSPVPALVRVATGSHDVAVTKTGFAPFAAKAEVTPDGKAVVDVNLAAVPTQAHLVVRSTGIDSLRVLVDGVDVGATPWEGDVAPGPHQITGRSSKAAAPAQPINVAAGSQTAVDLAPASTAAHLVLHTSDGKGLITVDGVAAGEGAYSGDVTSGEHTFSVTRDGFKPATKTVTLGANETWAETVTLEPIAVTVTTTTSGERPYEGIYGGFGLAGALGVGGQGTELETNCDTLGATSCDTPSPTGGALFGYVGYTWNPVGFEVMLAGIADQTQQEAHFNGTGGTSGNLPFSDPARDEKFNFVRVGGIGAIRVRASTQGRLWRLTAAGGVGVSYRQLWMARRATATDGSGRIDGYFPSSEGYASPALTLEGAFQYRLSQTIAISVGLEMWADNASIGGDVDSPPSPGHALVAPGNPTPAPIPTPEYHYATGPQVFLLPFIGMQFGP
jgi:hypothetical protein